MRRPFSFAGLLALLPVVACASLLGDDFTVSPDPSGQGGTAASGNGGGVAVGGSDGAGAAGGSGGGGIGPGPIVASSLPTDGALQAGINPYAIVYFDRVVTVANAAGNFSIEGGGNDKALAQVVNCPEPDPTCIGVLYPSGFAQGDNRKLKGASDYVLTISKDFEDTDGNANLVDQTISFRTYAFDLDFFDDSAAIDQEAAGIAFVPTVPALYVHGLGDENGQDGPVLRRVDLDGAFQPTGAETVGVPKYGQMGGGPYAYGLDYLDAATGAQGLYLAWTYPNAVLRYNVAAGGALSVAATYEFTQLPSPDEELYGVMSTTSIDGTLYFGHGFGSPVSGILQLVAGTGFSVWLADDGVFDASDDFHVAAGQGPDSNILYVANEKVILKIDRATKSVINQHDDDQNYYDDTQLRVDSKGRLYVADGDDLRIYDTSGTTGFAELAARESIHIARFDIREEGDDVHVYFLVNYRGEAKIGTTSFSF